MKLLSGSIEIEKCGNTENKSKEATLPFELEQSLKHSNQLYFRHSWISCDISTASSLSLLSPSTGSLGSLLFYQSEVSSYTPCQKNFTYTLVSALTGNRLLPPLEDGLLETKKTIFFIFVCLPPHPSHEPQIQYVLNKGLLN